MAEKIYIDWDCPNRTVSEMSQLAKKTEEAVFSNVFENDISMYSANLRRRGYVPMLFMDTKRKELNGRYVIGIAK